MSDETEPTSEQAGPPRIRQVTDINSGEQLQIVYAIPPELIEGGPANAEEGIALADLVHRFWRGKWVVMASVVLGSMAGIFFALSQQNVYTAQVTALPPSESGSGGNLAQYAGLAAMAGVQLPSGPASSVDEIMAILESRRLAEPLIEAFGLQTYYNPGPGKLAREDLLASFAGDFSARHSTKDNRITFGYTHQEPQVALAVTEAAAEALKRIFNQIHQSDARRELVFLNERLQQARTEHQQAVEALADFQRETGAIEIEAQTKATIEAIAQLQGELIAQQVELRALLASQVNEDNPRTQLLQERIAAANEQMRTLLGNERVEDGVLVALGTAPALSVRYLGLLREVKKQEAILGAVMAQQQSAEINVARSSEALSIVDEAVLPEKKSGPARARIAIVATILGGMLGTMFVFLPGILTVLRSPVMANGKP